MSEFVNTVDLIGDDALTDGLISGTITELRDDRVRTIPKNRFGLNKTLVTIDCPNATSVGDSAFAAATALTTVNLQSATTAGERCFQGATALVEVNMPSLPTVRAYFFLNCKLLEKVCLSSAKGVVLQAFKNCSSLKILDLPKCTGIGDEALYGCTGLIALALRNDAVAPVNNNAIDSCGISAGTCYIYVPAALIDSYKAATNWSTYADQFRALEDYTVDGTTTGELDETKI